MTWQCHGRVPRKAREPLSATMCRAKHSWLAAAGRGTDHLGVFFLGGTVAIDTSDLRGTRGVRRVVLRAPDESPLQAQPAVKQCLCAPSSSCVCNLVGLSTSIMDSTVSIRGDEQAGNGGSIPSPGAKPDSNAGQARQQEGRGGSQSPGRLPAVLMRVGRAGGGDGSVRAFEHTHDGKDGRAALGWRDSVPTSSRGSDQSLPVEGLLAQGAADTLSRRCLARACGVGQARLG